jgi:plastocyanin
MQGGIRVLKNRGVVAAIVAVVGTLAVGVAGASGGAATDVTVYAVEDGGTYCFSTSPTTCNGNLEVAVNGATNKVTFAFPGPYTAPHNARSTSANWTYKSHEPSTDPTAVEDPDYDFTTNGTYTFHCDAHSFMTGTITVTGAADPTSTATATATASATPSTQPSDPGTNTPPPTGGTADAVKPTLRSFGATVKRRAVKVSFRLSENATVTIRVKRGSRVVKTVTKQLAAGKRSVSVRSSKLRKGRYKIEVRARDASGNVSTLASKSLRIRK